MPLSFFTTARFGLRALKGANKVSDVDAGFEALANDIDAILYPPGDLRLTARAILDAGWLACEGQAVNRGTYKALFEAIGTAYGAGDGATTFNVPDYRGRVPMGAGLPEGAAGATNHVRGTKGGEETHALRPGELPEYVTAGAGGGSGYASVSAGAGVNFNVNGVEGTTGGGHNNMQPYTACNTWIKT